MPSDSEDEASGPEAPRLACRLDFEVVAPWEQLQALRKLHSTAVRRRHALLPFFQTTDFDQGPQLDGLGEERHLIGRLGGGAPVLLAPRVAWRGYAELIQRGAAAAEHGPLVEPQICDWFLEAWQAHLEELQVVRSAGRCLIVRLAGGRDLEGLVIRVLGVRSRDAQGEKLQLRLGAGDFGVAFQGRVEAGGGPRPEKEPFEIVRPAWKRRGSPEGSRPMRWTSRSNTLRSLIKSSMPTPIRTQDGLDRELNQASTCRDG